MQAVELDTPRPIVDGNPVLALQLFGAFTVCREGRALPRLRTRKELWLLALLTLQGSESPIDRTRLAGMLWPEASESRALSNLRRSLSELRDALASQAWRIASPTPRTLQLDLTDAQCDVVEFDRLARSSEEQPLRRAAFLYRGALLSDCFEDWIAPEREARQRVVLAALESLAARARQQNNLSEAATHLRLILQIEPFREPALRALMETLADQGSPAAAGEVYRAFRWELRRALNAEPSSETVQLSREIRLAGRRVADPPGASARGGDEAPASTARYRLPAALSPLIGRQAECAAVIELLRGGRLVTLTGTGGVGKTRLAIAAAEEIVADFDDGACFIDLSTLSDPAHIPMLVLTELGEREPEKGELVAALEEFLRPRKLLLLLDNCEHMLDDCARLASTLLKKCPQLRLLATSREPLHVPGEGVWPVPSLVPAEATWLFASRAAQARFGFRMTEANTEAADRVCRRLEGMPLAIEMAAARVRGVSVPQIASEMDDVVRLLNQRGGNQDARQQTLRATLDWSYRLLEMAEQALLTRLSIFAGGCTLALASAVCSDDKLPADDITDGMLSLVEKSLIEFSETPSGEGRYRLLETTRAYAAEMLSPEEYARLSDRRAEYFVEQANTLEGMQGAPTGGENEVLLAIEAELPNVRAALSWCQSRGSARSGLLIAGNFRKFWWVRGHITEGRQHILAALSRETDEEDYMSIRASALRAIGVLAYFQWDFDIARKYYEEALPINRALAEDGNTASVLLNLGLLFTAQGDLVRARVNLLEALEIFVVGENEHCVSKCRHSLADILLAEGDLKGARESYELLYRHYEKVGDRNYVAASCNALASVCRETAKRDPATGGAEMRKERSYILESLKINIALAQYTGIATCLEWLASLAVRQGHFLQASILHAAGSTVRQSADGTRLGADELEIIENDNLRSREALGSAEFEAARTEGKAMTTEEAVAYALACDGDRVE